MKGRSILALHENDKGGCDYLAADIHGNLQVLEAHLEALGEIDRLCLAGDLLDRGNDNLAVMSRVFDYQQQHPEKLFVTVGNHELFFLSSLEYLEEYVHVIAAINDMLVKPEAINAYCEMIKQKACVDELEELFQYHLKSGGEWLVAAFKQELLRGAITFVETEAVSSITYSENSLLWKIKTYFQALPAAIYCDAKKPYIVVHADMPIDDVTLMHHLKYSLPFTAQQLDYATSARDIDDMRKNELPSISVLKDIRSPQSIIVYAGHTVILFREHASIVRYYSNTVNLDVAAHATSVALRVNHTRGTCDFVGKRSIVDDLLTCFPRLLVLQKELNQHLQNEMKRYAKCELKAVNEPDSVAAGKRPRGEALPAVGVALANASPRLFAHDTELKKARVDEGDELGLSISRNGS